MNINQRYLLRCSAFICLLIVIFPPLEYLHPNIHKDCGFKIIYEICRAAAVNVPYMLMLLLGLTIITTTLYFSFKN